MSALLWVLLWWGVPASQGQPLLVAHRGSHHSYRPVRPPWKCRQLQGPQRHAHLENTLASIQDAFARGADVVEIDLVVTRDLYLVLSHEAELDCTTNRTGPIAEYTLAQLKAVDLGYNSTFDGQSYPWRGQGVGQVVTLQEVLRRFPQKKFLLNPKEQPAELFLQAFQRHRDALPRQSLFFWGDEELYHRLRKLVPFRRYVATPSRAESCYQQARLFAVLGFFPDSCRGLTLSLLPEQVMPFGGWPFAFAARMREHGGGVWLFLPNRITELRLPLGVEFEAIIVSNIDRWRRLDE